MFCAANVQKKQMFNKCLIDIHIYSKSYMPILLTKQQVSVWKTSLSTLNQLNKASYNSVAISINTKVY